MDHHTESTSDLSRRSLLAGLGAVGGGLALGAVAADPASAEETPEGFFSSAVRAPRSTTLGASMASAPEAGVNYVFRDFYDFTPEGATSQRTWTPRGVYTANSASVLYTSVDLPAGAVLHDIEWYASNRSTTETRYGQHILWQAGNGSAAAILPQISFPINTMTLSRFRGVVDPSVAGPFPHGTRLLVGVFTPTDATAGVGGVRVGYKPGGTTMTLLPTPIRAYDSRSADGPLAPNSTRTVSLASALPAAAVGALLNVTILDTVGSGTVRIGAGGATPVTPVIRWGKTGDSDTNPVTTAVSATGTINVQSAYATGNTSFVVDVLAFHG
jgi:hypothetical protein